ncbi:Acetylene hydratase [Moorella thermoacetica]|uniref:molybdopterin-containing oxidoreductase family protein n=1 Tax=Neomoorella thermoacetica TaxID=1525 RepID=UPI0030CF59E3
MTKNKHQAICGVCPGGCAVTLEMEDNRLVAIAPRREAPFGDLCIRGQAAPEIVYSPDRLRRPLMRTGARGEGQFREATWEEALDFVTTKMQSIKKEYGPQAMMSHSGRGAFEHSLIELANGPDTVASKLLWPFGSPNIASVGSLCYTSFGILAPMTTLGLPGARLVPDLEHTSLIVVWGANPATDSPPFIWRRILAARRQGIRMIAIDHMRSDVARKADEWLAVRPGTDGALALGMLHVIIKEGLYDHEFVSSYTTGFTELQAYVEQFTPEAVERITWVPAEKVEALAREIARTRHATLRMYTGLEYTNSGVQNIRAVLILWALTGNLDVPGGLYINPPPTLPLAVPVFPRPAGIKPIGAEKYPLFYELTGSAHFMEFPPAVLEGKPYPIKGLLVNGSSILTSYPQPEIFAAAFRRLELLVVIDRFLTRDALFADVVLPATTYFEINSYQRYPGYVRLRRRVIEPVGEARNDLLIFAALARRLGFGHLYPRSEEEVLAWAFAKDPALLQRLQASEDGVRLEGPERRYEKYKDGLLRPDGQPGFPTPSGKLEIKSTLLARHGYAPLPEYTEPVEGPLASPGVLQEFPLVLNTGARLQSTFRSQHLNIPGLVKIQDKPLALINPGDAARRGIKNGARIKIKTRWGEVYFYARVTPVVPPGVVEANQGGGNPLQVEAWREGNINLVTDFGNRDPISGFPVFKALLCEVEPG